MDSVDSAKYGKYNPVDNIIKRQSERKKVEEKNNLKITAIEEIETFLQDFNEKKGEIEKEIELSESIEPDELRHHFSKVIGLIQELQKCYSSATIFLRAYDKKICQNTIQVLHLKLKDVESRLMPKKKFGFKNRRNKVEAVPVDMKNGDKKTDFSIVQKEKFHLDVNCGFRNRCNEVLVLKAEEIEKKDVLLSDLKNSTVELLGNPTTLHITNLENCKVYSGPVTTSVFVEKIENSVLQVACQQLRIHETINTDFFVHVTSKAIIEDSKNVRFGEYNFSYDGIEEHYKLSGLDKNVNNWDKIDDFNWLAVDKPSPNWSKLLD